MSARNVERRWQQRARLMGGEIGLRGEKKLLGDGETGSRGAVKTPENGRTNPSGGNWARCVMSYWNSGWGGNRLRAGA